MLYFLVAWRVILVVAFSVLPPPPILGGGRDLSMVRCISMNAGSVVGILRGGGDTQTIPAVIGFV